MLKLGSLIKYREGFLKEALLGIILAEENLGPTDYAFYRVLLEDGKVAVIADTRLSPV